MTDNRTTELREKLTERGVEFATDDFDHLLTTYWQANNVFVQYLESIGDYVDEDDPTMKLSINNVTPEQAIAATLGSDEPPYDELLRCLENDWNICASWDGLRKFWCIELTEKGVRLRNAVDTIEGMRDSLRRACQFIEGYGSCPYDTFDLYEPWEESCYQKCSADIDRAECWRRYFENGDDSSRQAIADELNARAERTCHIIEYDEVPYPVCSECGAVQPDDYTVYFCWNCGAKVRNA